MKVIVMGNCTIDVSFAVGKLPREGESVLASGRQVDLGGKGANQAVVASRFGAETILAAPIGTDGDGDWACQRLTAEGLRLDAILREEPSSDQSVIFVSADGENCIVSTCLAARSASPEWARITLQKYAESGDILLMQGNLSLETTHAALVVARECNLMTIVNPAPVQYGWASLFPMANVVILNRIEAIELGGLNDPVAAAAAIKAGGVPCVILTLGAEGVILLEAQGIARLSARAVEAVDTVGAGDTLCGAFAAGVACGLSPANSLRRAMEAALVTVTRKGTQTSFPTRAEARALSENFL
jgi:ribokinase